MSASSVVARRAAVRNGAPFLRNANAASAISRALLSSSTGIIGRGVRTPRYVDAIAILVPVRHIGTEHHRIDPTPSSAPPPGFNAEAAKQPLPKESSTPAAPKKETDQPKTDVPATATASTTSAKKDVPAKVDGEADKSDASLTELAAAKQALEKSKKDEKKLTLWEKVKKEAHHYWDGTKLLATEVKISWRLALKMAAGYELTRRENRQLRRTVQDLARLVPFSVFIIVPLGEAFLPLALKLFPNMLPSTYEGKSAKEKKANLLRATRKEVSEFLRGSIKETGLPLSAATAQKEEFSNFFRKVRSTGEKPTAEDVIKVCKIFRDDVTLDNLSRPQLVSMCRYMNLNTFGTDSMLRYQIRHRMRQIKRDDHSISFEGVDSLTVAELQTACASRGIRTHGGVSPARMRTDLQAWLDLRLKEGVPSTLLVLSNAYMYSQYSGSEEGNQIDALIGVLSSIPEELYHEIELEVHDAQGAATNKQRLEVLKEQEELIEDEREQNQASESTGFASPRDVENIDEQEAQAQAKSAGVEKGQVGEMLEAQREGIAAEKKVADEEKRA